MRDEAAVASLELKKIGFIGVGIMGKSMVRNLMKAGFELTIYARNKEKVRDIIEEGAFFTESPAACAKGQDAVITIVGFPADVEEVYFGEWGLIDNSSPGTYLIDMTTTSPKLSKRIYQEGKHKNLHVVDAPVTGGDLRAREGTLTILAGGDEVDFVACKPLFEAMGENINYMGQAGNGQHTKLANQVAIAGAMSGLCEALSYSEKNGLDLETVFQAIRTGSAASRQMEAYGPRILRNDMNPGFFMKHFIKDMALAEEGAKDSGLELGVLNHVLCMYRELEAEGSGDLGTQALIQYYK